MSGRKKGKKTKRKNRLWTLIVAFMFALGLFAFGQGKVVKVTDGDTVTVLTKDGRFENIRLYGIDCPESAQSGGSDATAFTQNMVFLSEVKITVLNKDQYNRSVALVHLPDGTLLNRELVKNGHAWVYSAYCKQDFCKEWKVLEQKAKKNKQGLWTKSNPKAPWDWRRENKRSH